MTKKDFQLIAQVIRDTDMSRQMEGTPASIMRRTFAESFANALSATNPRFKRELFIQAATGVVPVTARKPVGGHPRDVLRHYVSGAVERGEAEPITAMED